MEQGIIDKPRCQAISIANSHRAILFGKEVMIYQEYPNSKTFSHIASGHYDRLFAKIQIIRGSKETSKSNVKGSFYNLLVYVKIKIYSFITKMDAFETHLPKEIVPHPLHSSFNPRLEEYVVAGKILPQRSVFELDKEGFSPFHAAAAAGQVETVRAILGIDKKLCRLKEDETVQGQTGLHLAVLQQEVGAIVELITETDRNDVLYKKDEQGNTALHLATWRKGREAGDREIYEKLIEAGAQRGRDDGTTNVERTNSISTCQRFTGGWFTDRHSRVSGQSDSTRWNLFSHNAAMISVGPDHVKLYCVLITPDLMRWLEKPIGMLGKLWNTMLQKLVDTNRILTSGVTEVFA
ncbi:hypothetical protein HID58_005364 [Brassica napus]|uniref:Uncharacterized protein n=1 Tax=Brassica napus TaxID=3708 RepID=A0ABQ8E8C3_BRANA|nr:hypothetical protein HID58_005364 [Brassica napus]